jgi:hypothetical protein
MNQSTLVVVVGFDFITRDYNYPRVALVKRPSGAYVTLPEKLTSATAKSLSPA